jgi:hypothetical protein
MRNMDRTVIIMRIMVARNIMVSFVTFDGVDYGCARISYLILPLSFFNRQAS